MCGQTKQKAAPVVAPAAAAVAQAFKVGDRVRITHSMFGEEGGNKGLMEGGTGTVKTIEDEVYGVGVAVDNFRESIGDDGFWPFGVEELELISEVAPAVPQEFKVGDKVRVTTDDHFYFNKGDEFTVGEVENGGVFSVETGPGLSNIFVFTGRVELVPEVAPAVTQEFKVGDRVRIVSSVYSGEKRQPGFIGSVIAVGLKFTHGPIRVLVDGDDMELTYKPEEIELAPAVTPEPTKPTPYVTLELTQAEAEALHVVVRRIGGDMKNSPRKYTHRILLALAKAGVAIEPDHYEFESGTTMYFKEYPPKASKTTVDPLQGEPEVGAGFTGCGPRKPKVGDTIEFLRDYAGGKVRKGERAKLSGVNNLPGVPGFFVDHPKLNVGVSTDAVGDAYKLVPPEAPKPILLVPKDGDRARLLKNTSALKAGEIVKVCAFSAVGHLRGFDIQSTGCGNMRLGWTQTENLEVLV